MLRELTKDLQKLDQERCSSEAANLMPEECRGFMTEEVLHSELP